MTLMENIDLMYDQSMAEDSRATAAGDTFGEYFARAGMGRGEARMAFEKWMQMDPKADADYPAFLIGYERAFDSVGTTSSIVRGMARHAGLRAESVEAVNARR